MKDERDNQGFFSDSLKPAANGKRTVSMLSEAMDATYRDPASMRR